MRVKRSAMGAVIMRVCSPARFGEAGDLPLAREVAQAQPAHAEAAVEGARAPAQRTAIVGPHLELRGPRRLHHETGLRHDRNSVQARKGMPSALSSAFPFPLARALLQMTTPGPLIFSTLS